MATLSRLNYVDWIMSHIMCAICEKPVERIEREGCFELDAVRFRVWCHGDQDNCVITHLMIEDAKLEPGYAFTTARLEGQVAGRTLLSVDQVAQADRGRELSRHVQLPDRSAVAPGGQADGLLQADEVRDEDQE